MARCLFLCPFPIHPPLPPASLLCLPLPPLSLPLAFAFAFTMAEVQTNLLSYIITKLHSDVARIESLIHQVHTGQ
jgi:hypothetical protein